MTGPMSDPPFADPVLAHRLTRLEDTFRQIHAGQMAGVPVCNPRLAVEAVGFVPWEKGWVGALVTPWFLDLVHIARSATAWLDKGQGSIVAHSFPAGPVDMVVETETLFGPYQHLALFSPLPFLEDQDHARRVARGAVDHLMAPRKDAATPPTAGQLTAKAARHALAARDRRDALTGLAGLDRGSEST